MNENLPEFLELDQGGNYRLKVWAVPGAKKTEVVGAYQGFLKIKLKSPPVENKANKELLFLLSRLLGLKISQIHLESGQASRKKVVVFSIKQEPDWPFWINNK